MIAVGPFKLTIFEIMSKQTLRPPNKAAIRRNAKMFAALGDETRLQLLLKLSSGAPLSIKQLTTDLVVTRQAVTKHLRVLEGAQFVTKESHGRESRFSVQKSTVEEASTAINAIAQQWENALLRLKNFVETK